MRFLAIAIMTLALTGCTTLVNRFLYTPTALPQPAHTWAKANNAQTFQVTTSDGLTLEGIDIKPSASEKGSVVYFHGNGDNLIKAAKFAQPLTRKGYRVFVATYRGYSGNAGTPSEDGLMKDAQAFLNYANANSRQKPILLGFSLGASVALQLAASNDVRAVTTIGAFEDLNAMVPLGIGNTLNDRYDNIKAIREIDEPVLLLHGTKDHVIPYKNAPRLKAAAKNTNVRLYPIEGADHEVDAEFLADLFAQQMAALP